VLAADCKICDLSRVEAKQPTKPQMQAGSSKASRLDSDARERSVQPSVFEYLDYRQFLEASFTEMHTRNPRFSHRAFARLAGMTSPNLLQMVIKGQRGLPLNCLDTLMPALGLNRSESEFFADLVNFSHARKIEVRDAIFRKILKSAKFRDARPLAKEEYECFRDWWIPVVRELASHPACKADPIWICERIQPKVTIPQVEKALNTLLSLNLLRKQIQPPRFFQTDAVVRTSDEVASVAVAGYHRAVLTLASDAIDSIPSQERDIRAMTIGVSRKTAQILKERMTKLWLEILDEAGRESVPEIVIQCNMQIFPVGNCAPKVKY